MASGSVSTIGHVYTSPPWSGRTRVSHDEFARGEVRNEYYLLVIDSRFDSLLFSMMAFRRLYFDSCVKRM